MPRLRELKNNYTSGELDPRMIGRADNKHYFNGAELMRNVVALPYGGWSPRGGLEYLATLTAGGNYRFITFQKSTEQTYLVMLSGDTFRVFSKAGVLLATVTGQPWTGAHMASIAWAQNLDTLLIFHPSFRPRAIQREETDADWDSFNWPLNNIPQYAFPDTTYSNGVDEVQIVRFTGGSWTNGEPFTLTLGGEETSSIDYHSTEATLAANIQAALRALGSTSATGITATPATGVNGSAIQVTMGGADGDKPWGEMKPIIKQGGAGGSGERYMTVSVETKGVLPGEATWSATRGWPGCGTFFQGRLLMAGSLQRPQTLWGSRAGDQQDFNSNETSDDYGFDLTADTDDVSAFHQIFVGRHVQLFSSTGEFYLPNSDAEPITPKTIALRRTASRGIKRGMPVFDVDGGTFFIQAERREDVNGYRRGVALREFIFADSEQAYQANDVSLIAAHLIRDPVRVAIMRATTSSTSDYYFLVNADGTLTVLCTLRTQEVNAFTLQATRGSFLDVAVVGDEVFFAIQRTINGVATRTLERFNRAMFADCCRSGGAGATGTVAHLVGETVWVRVDGVWQNDKVVPIGGVVTFDAPAETGWQMGLAWPVVDAGTGNVYQVTDLPIVADLPDGPIMGRKRRVVDVTLQLLDTETVIVNRNRITGRRFGDALLDEPLPRITGEKKLRGLLGWDRSGRVRIGDDRPGPATVLAVAKSVGV